MSDFKILFDGEDLRGYCKTKDVYMLKRNADHSLVIPKFKTEISHQIPTVPSGGDIVLIYMNNNIFFYGYLDKIHTKNDGTGYDASIIHYLEKLKEYKIDYDTFHTALASGTGDQYGTAFYDGHYVQLPWLIKCMLNLIKGSYSVTVNGLTNNVFVGLDFQDIYFDEEMLYAIGQSGAANHNYWEDDELEDYYPIQDNKVSAFDLLSELTSIFKIYIYFWDNFIVNIEGNLNQYTIHKSKRWKYESKEQYAQFNNVTVQIRMSRDIALYQENTLTEEVEDNSFHGDAISNRNFKKKSLTNNLCFFTNMKATDDIAENGGFENWTGNVPDDWDVGGDAMLGPETNPIYVHGGSKSVSMLNYPDGAPSSFYQVYDLTYEGVYGKIVFWKYHVQSQLELRINGWKNGEWIEIDTINIGSNIGWDEDIETFAIPQGITKIMIIFTNNDYGSSPNQIWIDDYEIYIIQTPINEYAVSLMDIYARDHEIIDVVTEIDTEISRAQEIGFNIDEEHKLLKLDTPTGDAEGFPYTLPMEFLT